MEKTLKRRATAESKQSVKRLSLRPLRVLCVSAVNPFPRTLAIAFDSRSQSKSLSRKTRIASVLSLIFSLSFIIATWSNALSVHAQTAPLKEKVAALVNEGTSALERGDLNAARQSFQSALEVERDNVAAHTYLGVIADREGNLIEAEKHFSAAAIAAPLSPEARNNHGAILLRMGRMEQAASQFEISLRLDKNQPSALINLAQIRFAANTPEGLTQARELLLRASAIAPDAQIARDLLVIALRQGDTVAAARFYAGYKEQIAGAQGHLIEPQARAELGAALLGAGLPDEAANELSAALQAAPNSTDVILLLARAHLARKDIQAAGRTLEGAVARGLEAGPIYAALADIYEMSGHVENAIPAMRLAIERDPRNEQYRFRYGMLLTDTKAPGAAVLRLQESLKLFPNSARLWFALGIAHFADHNAEEAAKDFQHALEADQKFAPALAYIGMTEAEQGQYARAVDYYERALAVDEKLTVAHYLLADAMLKETSPDLSRVESHLQRAVSLDQSFAPARLALGKLYFRMNRLEDAASQLERVIALNPNLAEAHYQLGRVYTRLKREREAQAALATFKRLSDEQKEQSQNERRDIVHRLANVMF
jgi:Tfp pilus assembly protein PilF